MNVPLAGTELVRETVLALRQGRKPGKEINWLRIEVELQQTEPYFPTVEEAIACSRRRSSRAQKALRSFRDVERSSL